MLKQERPHVLILERPVHFKNANSVLALVGAYSMVTLAALHLGVKIAEVRPSELKMQTGKEMQTKRQSLLKCRCCLIWIMTKLRYQFCTKEMIQKEVQDWGCKRTAI